MKKQILPSSVCATFLILASANASAVNNIGMGANCTPNLGTTTTYSKANGSFKNTSPSVSYEITCPVYTDLSYTSGVSRTFTGNVRVSDYSATNQFSCTRSVVENSSGTTYNSTVSSGASFAGGTITLSFPAKPVISAGAMLYRCTVPPGGVSDTVTDYVVTY